MSGTATVGAITFSGNEMRAELSGVADEQNVVLHTEDINGDGLPHGDVPFGFLAADVTGSRVVDKPDLNSIKANQGAVNAGNFRNDVNADGTIAKADAHAGQAEGEAIRSRNRNRNNLSLPESS